MGGGEREQAAADRLFACALRAGESRVAARAVLEPAPDEQVLAAVLRRAVPVAFLEEVAALAAVVRAAPGARAGGAPPARSALAVAAPRLGALLARPRGRRGDGPGAGRGPLARGVPPRGRSRRHAARGPRHPRPAGDPRPPSRPARGRRSAGRGVGAREPAPARGGPRGGAAPGRRAAGASRVGGGLVTVGRRTTRRASLSCCSRARRSLSPCCRSARSWPATCAGSRETARCGRSSGRRRGRSSTACRAPDPPILYGSTRCIIDRAAPAH